MLDMGSGKYPVVAYSPTDEGNIRELLAPIAWGNLQKNNVKLRENLLRGLKANSRGDLLSNLLDTPDKISKLARSNFDHLPASIRQKLIAAVTPGGDFPDSAFFVRIVPTPSES